MQNLQVCACADVLNMHPAATGAAVCLTGAGMTSGPEAGRMLGACFQANRRALHLP